MNSNELKEIKNRLESLPGLEKRLAGLVNGINEAKEELIVLLKTFEKETLDVEKMNQNTLSAMLFKFIGKYEAKLTKEEKEELEAKLKYDQAVERVKILEQDYKELEGRIGELKKEQEIYQDALDERERELKNHLDTEAGNRYIEQEKEQKELRLQFAEITEARAMGHKVIETISAIMSYLDKAEDWATYDVFSRGGILTHMMKYEHLDDADREFYRLASQLKDFKKEVEDVGDFDVPMGVGIDSGTRTFDFWFDNVFTDLNVRDKIESDKEQVKRLQRHVEGVMGDLKNTYREIELKLEDAEVKKEDLIINLV